MDALLGEAALKRAKSLEDRAHRDLPEKIKAGVVAASTVDDLHATLQPVVDSAATPDIVPAGAMVLQPSEERRRSGSHYTPRSLTEPIVRTTLEPILAGLRGTDGRSPMPQQILALKVCDPAMGSGAFLVEVCRQLGEALVDAWHEHGAVPVIPPDEDEFMFAQRLVAQRCLYGVDRNPVAVDLAKVSLWLATLARDHPLTFLDHAFRHGDSLVGLSRKQIEVFHWDNSVSFESPLRARMREQLQKVAELRRQIRDADESTTDWELRDLWDQAQFELRYVRLLGDLLVAAFFEGEKPRDRERRRSDYVSTIRAGQSESYRDRLEEWRHADPPLAPLHWEVEFPEVFERENPGFDAFVGNPPFAGRTTITTGNVSGYISWLMEIHPESHGNADLVAHFFRRAFELLREGGTFGLIATNTIGQGDTRATGLRWVCQHDGEIFAATKRVAWPGLAAVTVSVIHVMKGGFSGDKWLDGRKVDKITAFLFHAGGHDDPNRLSSNRGKSFQGSLVVGVGFTFDDTDPSGLATPIAEMNRLIEKDPRNQELIFPYIGGDEVNTSPTHAYHRYIINFGERTEAEARRWPDLMSIVEEKVRPEREASLARSWSKDKEKRARNWWQFSRSAKDLHAAIEGLPRVLFHGFTCRYVQFAFLPMGIVYAGPHNVFPLSSYSAFCALQSRPHELWVRFFASSLQDDLRYTPSDCFETYPFCDGWETHPALEAAGKDYYEFRAELMVRTGEGLTRTYNRFHNPEERDPNVLRLRELHAAMDRAVLDAYGWTDIATDCEFLLDYEVSDEEGGSAKRPWRYRWSDDVHDEVLARLLELNTARAREEARLGSVIAKGSVGRGRSGRASRTNQEGGFFS